MPSKENQEFDFFATFLRQTNEKNVAAKIINHLIELLLKDKITSDAALYKCSINDPGCGDGTFSKEVLQSLSKYGLKFDYEGTDQSSDATSKTQENIKHLQAVSQCHTTEGDINHSDQKLLINDIILLSHAAYYIKNLSNWIINKANSLSRNGIMLLLHAPSFSIHHRIREEVQNVKKTSPVDAIIEALAKQSEYKIISVPFSSFVYFKTDLSKLKEKYENKDETRTAEESEDEKLLKFISFGDSEISKATSDQLIKAIVMVQESFISSQNAIIIWDVIQIIAPKGSIFFLDIQKEILPNLLEISPYISPLHYAAFEGKLETYNKVKSLIERIYGKAGRAFFTNPYKIGVATPLYMSLMGYKNSITASSRTMHLELVKELIEYTDINNNDYEKWSKIIALGTNNPEIHTLLDLQEQDATKQKLYFFEAITKDLAIFTANNILDRKLSEINRLLLDLYIALFNEYFDLDKAGLQSNIISSEHFIKICSYLNSFAANLLYHKHDGKRAREILKFNKKNLEIKITEIYELDEGEFISNLYKLLESPKHKNFIKNVIFLYSSMQYLLARTYFYIQDPNLLAQTYEEFKKAAKMGLHEKVQSFDGLLAKVRGTVRLLMDEERYNEAIDLLREVEVEAKKTYTLDFLKQTSITPIKDLQFIYDIYERYAICYVKIGDKNELDKAVENLLKCVCSEQDTESTYDLKNLPARFTAKIYISTGKFLQEYANNNWEVSKSLLSRIFEILGLKEDSYHGNYLIKQLFLRAEQISSRNDFTKKEAAKLLLAIYKKELEDLSYKDINYLQKKLELEALINTKKLEIGAEENVQRFLPKAGGIKDDDSDNDSDSSEDFDTTSLLVVDNLTSEDLKKDQQEIEILLKNLSHSKFIRVEELCLKILAALGLQKINIDKTVDIYRINLKYAFVTLGKIYHIRGNADKNIDDLTEAAKFYQYALRYSENNPQEIYQKLNNIKINLLNIISFQKHTANNSADQMMLDRLFIEELRERTKIALEEIENEQEILPDEKKDQAFIDSTKLLYAVITDKMKSFLANLYKESELQLGKKPCEYTVISLGSMALGQITPYSDIEFAILTENSNYRHSQDPKIKNYFTHLSQLVHLRVINLGESQIASSKYNIDLSEYLPKGISFDLGGKTPLGRMDKPYSLIQTVDSMIYYLKNEGGKSEHRDKNLPYILEATGFIYGKNDLYNIYVEKVQDFLSSEDSGAPVSRTRAIKRLKDGVIEHDYIGARGVFNTAGDLEVYRPCLGSQEDEGRLMYVKAEHYRLMDRLAYNLGLYYNKPLGSLWQTLDTLHAESLFCDTNKKLIYLKFAASYAAMLRLKCYISSKAQNDNFDFLQDGIKLWSTDTMSQFFTISAGFYFAIENLLRQNFDALKVIDFSPDYAAIRGLSYKRLGLYLKAKEFLLKADEELPNNIEVKRALVGTLARIGGEQNLILATKFCYQCLNLLDPKEAMYYIHARSLCVILFSAGQYVEAIKLTKSYMSEEKEKFGLESIDAAIDYGNLGLAETNIGDYQNAEQHFLNSKHLFEQSINNQQDEYIKNKLSDTLNNLGHLYMKMNRLSDAKHMLLRSKQLKVELKNHLSLDMLTALRNLAIISALEGDLTTGIKETKKCLLLANKLFGDPSNDITLGLLNDLGEMLRLSEKHIQAIAIFQETLEKKILFYRPYDPRIAPTYENLGLSYLELKKYTEAYSCLISAIKIHLKNGNHLQFVKIINNLALLYSSHNKYHAANLCFKLYIISLKNLLYYSEADFARFYYNFGTLEFRFGNYENAEQTFRIAGPIFQKLKLLADYNKNTHMEEECKLMKSIISFLDTNCLQEDISHNILEKSIDVAFQECWIFKARDSIRALLKSSQLNLISIDDKKKKDLQSSLGVVYNVISRIYERENKFDLSVKSNFLAKKYFLEAIKNHVDIKNYCRYGIFSLSYKAYKNSFQYLSLAISTPQDKDTKIKFYKVELPSIDVDILYDELDKIVGNKNLLVEAKHLSYYLLLSSFNNFLKIPDINIKSEDQKTYLDTFEALVTSDENKDLVSYKLLIDIYKKQGDTDKVNQLNKILMTLQAELTPEEQYFYDYLDDAEEVTPITDVPANSVPAVEYAEEANVKTTIAGLISDKLGLKGGCVSQLPLSTLQKCNSLIEEINKLTSSDKQAEFTTALKSIFDNPKIENIIREIKDFSIESYTTSATSSSGNQLFLPQQGNYGLTKYFVTYYGLGIENLLPLRLYHNRLNGVAVLPTSFLNKNAIPLLLHNALSKIQDGFKIVIAPLNIDGKHWVGLVIEKQDDHLDIKYLDSENREMSLNAQEALLVSCAQKGYRVALNPVIVEEQKYSNCGPELIENFAMVLTGTRTTQEAAVPLHSLLYANSILDPASSALQIAENSRMIEQLSNKNTPLYSMSTTSDTSQNQDIALVVPKGKLPKSYNAQQKYTDVDRLLHLFQKYGIKMSLDEAMTDKGFRKASLKLHPDKGGNKEDFQFFKDFRDKYNNHDTIEQPIFSAETTIQKVCYYSSLTFKSLDVGINTVRAYNNPTIHNVADAAIGGSHLLGMITGVTKLSTTTSVISIGYKCYTDGIYEGVKLALVTSVFIAVPSVLALVGPPYLTVTYTVLLTAYSGYSMVSNGWSLYDEFYKIDPTEIQNSGAIDQKIDLL